MNIAKIVVLSVTLLLAVCNNPSDNDGAGILTDRRNNQTYRTVKIGNLNWMAENLNYATDSSWCYNNSPDSCAKYGRLYNWNAAMVACPAGWHLPSHDDWGDMVMAVGGSSQRLKATWGWPEGYSGNDSSGFSALPGGYRERSGVFPVVSRGLAAWWSSATVTNNEAQGWCIGCNDGIRDAFDDKHHGFSVRCVKN